MVQWTELFKQSSAAFALLALTLSRSFIGPIFEPLSQSPIRRRDTFFLPVTQTRKNLILSIRRISSHQNIKTVGFIIGWFSAAVSWPIRLIVQCTLSFASSVHSGCRIVVCRSKAGFLCQISETWFKGRPFGGLMSVCWRFWPPASSSVRFFRLSYWSYCSGLIRSRTKIIQFRTN